MLLYHHISLFFARQYFSLHFMPYIDPALNKAGWPLVFYLNFCQQCPDNPAHFTQTTICLWRMLSCCVGCRICSCVLVFNSAFCFATFLWLLCPLESMRGGRTLQLLHLQSSVEGSQWLLLCSEVSYQLQFRAAGREAVEISTVVIQCYEVLSPCFLRKHEWNTICWLHTYISCNLSMMLWKEKNSTSQGHDAAKYEACSSHLHGCPECFSSLGSSELAVLSEEKAEEIMCFSSFV